MATRHNTWRHPSPGMPLSLRASPSLCSTMHTPESVNCRPRKRHWTHRLGSAPLPLEPGVSLYGDNFVLKMMRGFLAPRLSNNLVVSTPLGRASVSLPQQFAVAVHGLGIVQRLSPSPKGKPDSNTAARPGRSVRLRQAAVP